MRMGRYGKNVGWGVTGLIAVIYGLGVAFIGNLLGEDGARLWTMWGSVIVGLLFLIFMVIPFFLWLFGSAAGTRR